jgi:hypothetical protein
MGGREDLEGLERAEGYLQISTNGHRVQIQELEGQKNLQTQQTYDTGCTHHEYKYNKQTQKEENTIKYLLVQVNRATKHIGLNMHQDGTAIKQEQDKSRQ